MAEKTNLGTIPVPNVPDLNEQIEQKRRIDFVNAYQELCKSRGYEVIAILVSKPTGIFPALTVNKIDVNPTLNNPTPASGPDVPATPATPVSE